MNSMTTIQDVSELVLLRHGRRRLLAVRSHPLRPRLLDHRAEIMIGVFQARWMKVPFCELVVTVSCEGLSDGRPSAGYFLLGGWNSSRFFSVIERHHFKTPYRPGSFTIGESRSRAIEILDQGQLLFRLEARDTDHETSVTEDWHRPVWFADPARPGHRRSFSAMIASHRTTLPVDPARDLVDLGSATTHPVLAPLTESHFVPLEWRFGHRAIHARTGTRRERIGNQREPFAPLPSDQALTAPQPVVDLFC